MEGAPTKLGDAFRTQVASWVEQREYIAYAFEALTSRAPAAVESRSARKLAGLITAACANAMPAGQGSANVGPDLTGYTKLSPGDVSKPMMTSHFTFTVDPTTGGLSSLKQLGRNYGAIRSGELVSPANTSGYNLFQFVYRTHNQKDDFTPFRNNITGDWATFNGSFFTQQPGKCYDKVGLDNVTCNLPMGCAESQDWLPASVAVYAKYATKGNHVNVSSSKIVTALVAELTMPTRAHTVYGAPERIYVSLYFVAESKSINVGVQWVGKTPTRLPEASILALPFAPCNNRQTPESAGSTTAWSVDKLSSWVDATDVVGGGAAVHLHAVGDGGARRSCGSSTLHVVSLDSALMTVGRATAFPTPATLLSEAEASTGLYSTLHNNYWDTNYPMWLPFMKKSGTVVPGEGAKCGQPDPATDSFRYRVWWD
jgi:hypothetical protein